MLIYILDNLLISNRMNNMVDSILFKHDREMMTVRLIIYHNMRV